MVDYYEKAETRTQQIQRADWQMEIPGQPNNTTENLKFLLVGNDSQKPDFLV